MLGVAMVALPSGPAAAEDPVELEGAYVLDTVGAIAGQEDEVRFAIDSLFEETGIKLFVVYVDRFTGAEGQSWADATATLNGFGASDVLMAVAVTDRHYELSYPANFEVDQERTDEIESDLIVPALRNDNWAGAAIAAADGLADARTGGGIPWLILGGVVVLGVVGLFIFSLVRRNRTRATARASQQQLDQRAGQLLVQLDDAIKTSEQELGFALAQFGEAAAKPFLDALTSAKQRVRSAFELQQKLDDAFPETAEEKRSMTLQIIELCEAADKELDAQADAFDELRELEKTAPAALAEAKSSIAALRERLGAARATLTGLAERHSPSALSAVKDNPDQAQELLTFAERAAAEADAALGSSKPARAAVEVRGAQAALGQVGQLLDAIDTAAVAIAEAESRLDTVIAGVRQDLAAATALQDAAGHDGSGLGPAIATAHAAIDAAADRSDPITALANLQKADSQLDTVLATARDQQERLARARSSLDAALATARAKLSATNDFITTRRGGVATTARTRLSEAIRHFEAATALSGSDPVSALHEANAASSLAEDSLRLAQRDVQGFGSPMSYGGGGDLGSAILGGIVGGLLTGGGSRGGGFFSGGGGMFGGGSRGGGFSSGGRSSGSFGGSSRRSSGGGGRRSSGGRF